MAINIKSQKDSLTTEVAISLPTDLNSLDQLMRSSMSAYANYRAACRCKSRKDFISKIGTVVEESDETQLWLELLCDSGLITGDFINSLLQEAGEITAIMTKSKQSAIENQGED